MKERITIYTGEECRDLLDKKKELNDKTSYASIFLKGLQQHMNQLNQKA